MSQTNQQPPPSQQNPPSSTPTRKHLHTNLLTAHSPQDEEGTAAIQLNTYRLRFGGNPPRFAEWIEGLGQHHFWHGEYARANLAWNVVFVRGWLRGRGGRGVGDDVEGDFCEGDVGREKDKAKNENKSLKTLWKTFLNTKQAGVQKRNLLTSHPTHFPLEQPTPLITWYDDLVLTFKHTQRLHEATFYRELVLRDFVGRVVGMVGRAEGRRVDALGELRGDLSEHEDGEFLERGEEGWRPADGRFWVYVEVEEGEGEDERGEDGEEEGGIVREIEKEVGRTAGGRYRLRKRKNEGGLFGGEEEKEKKKRK
ncbi:hypothetical protein EG328_003372 [Venturia inaequalis]|uniref:Uncharacterized protein n=1 Tax=Venturia inaequalis TaxID=5025 RepID=A0A8H3VDX2_VENIN|nr:hypothetical protein EG328_003372 [Venturia inaequalis]